MALAVLLVSLSTALLASTQAAAERQEHAHASAAEPPMLMAGMGRLHHPIATRSPEAQRFFNQGLTLVYAFNHDEAIRSFQKAAAIDPQSPMPLWGIALALGPNINLDIDLERGKAAYDAVQRALVLATRAPAVERAYVNALVKRYSNDPRADVKALAVQYRDAMRDLSRAYPNDLDAATLYAESLMDLHPWQLWSSDGTPTEGTTEIVEVLESVLKRDPNHVGANHYYIHATEASPTPQRALASAKRLETLVPAAGHLVHMPAHTYMRTGDYAAALASNARAAEVDRRYIEERRVSGVYPAMYYTHNLDFLASAAMMTGQFQEALSAADEVVKNATAALADMPMIEPFAAKKLHVLLRFARWDEVLKLPRPDAALTILTATWHFGRGVAHAALGAAAEAERERRAYETVRQAIPPETAWNYNKAAGMLAVMSAVLDARIGAARKDDNAAIAAWQRAVAAEDSLSYNEPPDWFYPTRESLGAALLRAGRLAEARRTFRDDLQRNPRNPRSLFGWWQTLLALDPDDPMAATVARQFAEAWKSADVELRLADF
jgi:tetratricopeptide (TPR) repeat protein